MKKLNKFFAVLVALAMMATLCVMSAFAADYDSTKQAVTGTEADPAHGYLTKVFQMPEGTTTPDADFTFDWTQKTEGTGIQTTAADVTKLEKTLSFDGEAGTTTEGVKKVTKNYDFADASAFTKAGRYQFDVVELNNTNNGTENDAIENDTAQTLTYSPEKYLVTMDVANKTDGTGFYIRNIAVQKYNEDGTLGAKVNPTVPTGGEGSQFSYTNSYVKNLPTTPDGNDPDDPDNPTPTSDDTGLYIEKKVAGYNNEALTEADLAAPFTFSVKVTAPAVPGAKSTYVAKVVTVDTNSGAVSDAIATYNFASGTAQDVTLKHNQRLVFTDLDVGAKYEVTETADDGYTTAYVKTANGEAAAAVTNNAIAATSITEGKDSAEYTNTRKNSVTPTGILISNLPYIALALVAIGGLVAYVVVRRRDEENA